MPEEFYKKVEFLCKKISNVEWSGILLYTYEGTIARPESFIITLKDIILMDKGSSGATEYELNGGEDDFHIDYMEKYPDRRSWKIGHIHSHNTMGVFFSATDVGELKDNASAHNIYVSLIVNNDMKTCCRICYIEEPLINNISFQWQARNEKGETYISRSTENVVVDKCLVTHEAEIEISFPPESVFNDFFLENIQKVLEKKEERKTIYGYPYSRHDVGFYEPSSCEEVDVAVNRKLVTTYDPIKKLFLEAKICVTDYPTTGDYTNFIKLLIRASFPHSTIEGEELTEFFRNFTAFRYGANYIEKRIKDTLNPVLEEFFPTAENYWQKEARVKTAKKHLEGFAKLFKSAKSVINALEKYGR